MKPGTSKYAYLQFRHVSVHMTAVTTRWLTPKSPHLASFLHDSREPCGNEISQQAYREFHRLKKLCDTFGLSVV
jgi:hypothetical protein